MPARGIPGIYATRGHFLCAREGHSKHAARGRPMSANGPEHIYLQSSLDQEKGLPIIYLL